MKTSTEGSASKAPDCKHCPVRHRSIMAHIGDEHLDLLNEEKYCNVYRKGETIFREGNKPLGLYAIFSGKVKLYKTSDMGKEQIVRLAKSGDPLGYRSLIANEPYSSTAEVIEDSRICFKPASVFNTLLHNGNQVFSRVMQVMSEDLKVAEDRIASMATKTVRERTAESLILLRSFYGCKSDGETIDVSLSREDLANLVGTATESLIRMLSDFKQEKLVEMKDRSIRILDYEKLKHLAAIED